MGRVNSLRFIVPKKKSVDRRLNDGEPLIREETSEGGVEMT